MELKSRRRDGFAQRRVARRDGPDHGAQGQVQAGLHGDAHGGARFRRRCELLLEKRREIKFEDFKLLTFL